MNPARRYLLILCLFIILAPVIGLLNYAFLRQSYEFEPVDKVVRMQLQNGGLYLSAIHNTIYKYKLALYRTLKPRIVALGSSRVYQIRGRYFNVPFVNLGGAMQSFKQGERVLREMAATHKPEVILLGLDPWWFGSYGQTLLGGDDQAGGDNYPTGDEFRLDLVFLPCQWLLERRVSFRNFGQTLLGHNYNPFPAIGVYAAVNRQGFYQDGSLYDYGKVLGLNKRDDQVRFSGEQYLINRGMTIFTYDHAVIRQRWAEFVSLLKFARQENIQVITFLSPFPARVVDWMSDLKDNYAYLDELRATIPAVSLRHYDFFDPREFGSSDCEFLDGLHGGEITYVRMLREMGRDPASGLGPYLNWPEIDANIRQYSGKAMVPIHSFGPQYKEIDFLELGCDKK
jgi:hypothetical protein